MSSSNLKTAFSVSGSRGELWVARVTVRSRPHCAGGICKRSFISAVWPVVHTNLSQNGAFRKPSSNWRNLKTMTFRFRFWNDDVKKIMWFPYLRSFNTNSKWPLLNLSGEVRAENIWCVLCAKPPFLNSSVAVWRVLRWSQLSLELRADSPWVLDRNSTLRQTTAYVNNYVTATYFRNIAS